jgi:hypothetical protein
VERPVTSSPSNVTAPVFGRTIPRIVFSVVDFPEALPPSSETSSPAPTWISTSWRMWIRP